MTICDHNSKYIYDMFTDVVIGGITYNTRNGFRTTNYGKKRVRESISGSIRYNTNCNCWVVEYNHGTCTGKNVGEAVENFVLMMWDSIDQLKDPEDIEFWLRAPDNITELESIVLFYEFRY